MNKSTKITLICISAVLIAVILVVGVIVMGMNSRGKMIVNVRTALEEKNAEKLCEYIVKFDKNKRNTELEDIIIAELEKEYKSENYDGILFAEQVTKTLGTKALYVKPALSFCERLKKIAEDYKYAKQNAYMKGYWIRTDHSAYKNTVIIVAGTEKGLSATIRSVAPNYDGYKKGDIVWSGLEFYEDYRCSLNVIEKGKDNGASYIKSYGSLNMDNGTVIISVNGQMQTWTKSDEEKTKEMSYNYSAYKGSKWISVENNNVSITVTEGAGNRISFEVYNANQDTKLIIKNVTVTDGEGDFDSGDSEETIIAGTLRFRGQKLNVTFIGDDTYPDGDYVLE